MTTRFRAELALDPWECADPVYRSAADRCVRRADYRPGRGSARSIG
jgi:hypothetical protein